MYINKIQLELEPSRPGIQLELIVYLCSNARAPVASDRSLIWKNQIQVLTAWISVCLYTFMYLIWYNCMEVHHVVLCQGPGNTVFGQGQVPVNTERN